MATYDVSDIARFIVCKYIADGNPVTNMKLQKMLYYAWVEYYKQFGEYLFKDDICAWKYGSIVPKVNSEFRIFAGMPILRSAEPAEMDRQVIDFLIKFTNDHKDFTASGLINLTNRAGYPWKLVYREGEKYTRIPFSTIIAIECHA